MSLAQKIDTPSDTGRAHPGRAIDASQRAIALNAAGRRVERWITMATVLLPFVGVVTAVALFWGHGVNELDLLLLGIMYALTTLGVGVGFHRFATHRAFKTGPAVKALLIVLGSMAAQGPIFFWAAIHRRHHSHSDRPGDPHSPHLYGSGVRGTLRGLWHSHTGWLFEPQSTDWGFYIPDLLRDRLMVQLHRFYFLWIILGLVLPAIAGGAVTGSWTGAFHGLLWGGLVRIFLLHHSSWSINSICHTYGSQPYQVADCSANNVWLSIPSFGESWHNNHHAFPSSAMHGLQWWQIDLNGYGIRLLQALGLAWDVRIGKAGARPLVVNAADGPEGSERRS